MSMVTPKAAKVDLVKIGTVFINRTKEEQKQTKNNILISSYNNSQII